MLHSDNDITKYRGGLYCLTGRLFSEERKKPGFTLHDGLNFGFGNK
jgi:hypothetical protein